MPRVRPAWILAFVTWLVGCEAPPIIESVANAEPPAEVPRPSLDFREVAERVLPSIVYIQAEAEPPREIREMLSGEDSLPEGPVPVGLGSGVIFSSDGLILTNNHVVTNADRVLVVLHDRRYYEAEVVGRDPSTEVAVLRIDADGLTPARLGDSDGVALGEWVLAMGSPLGLQFSVTLGIVSGTGRSVGILGRDEENGDAPPLEHFIQTDAGLSPGNSGGPLVNGAGEVIGINTAIAAPRGVPASIGFAIPSNIARHVAKQLVSTGEVRRGYLGVVLVDVSPSLARARNLERVEGAMVVTAESDGPADRAGIRTGDVILAVGDSPVGSVGDLQSRLAVQTPGEQVVLQVVREGRSRQVRVKVAEVRTGVGANGP